MFFSRKESRPARPAREGTYRLGTAGVGPRERRVPPSGCESGRGACGKNRGGKAPLIRGAKALPLLIIPLLTLLFISFHPLSSPAAVAGEVAPSFAWPARGEVICPFRPAQGSYGAGGHAGIDISLPRGSDVRASAAGTVSFAGNTPVGRCVSVMHGGGFKTTYVSLEATAVRRGEKVARGQKLGTSDGSRDRSSSSPHLHFGLFLDGRAVDPLPFLQGRLLDPEECLFLGPWEDMGAIETYLESHDGGGFFDWLGRGIKTAGRAIGNACKGLAGMVGKALGAAWRWTCRAARAVGGAFAAFYRTCIEPWFVPMCKGVVEAFRAVLSNRYVQAVLAGLAAAAVVCLAVAAIALAVGISLATAVVAAVVGSLAAIGYSIYYACTAGDSFTFMGCFTASLTVGAAAAGFCLLLSYLAPLIGVGWSNLGWLGFGKAFLIHGCADSVVYIVFCLCTGREVSPMGVLASFVVGGLTGGIGKLVTTGLLSQGAVQALAAGWLSSGGTLFTGEAAASFSAYAWAATMHFTHKLAYVFLCGCTGFLGDVIIRAASGGRPSLAESLLAFGGGVVAGSLGLAGGGQGAAGLLARISGGRVKISSDLFRALVNKSLSKGLKEGSAEFMRWLKNRGRRPRESLWNLETGGEI